MTWPWPFCFFSKYQKNERWLPGAVLVDLFVLKTNLTVDSYTGKTTSPFVAPYSSTKSALNGFFGSLYHELAMKKSNVSISLCTLGLIDTEAAMDKVRLVYNSNRSRTTRFSVNYRAVSFSLFSRGVVNLPAYPATDAALNIIIIGATRQQELFYPWFTYIIVVTKDWFPSITNYIIQNSYNYIP